MQTNKKTKIQEKNAKNILAEVLPAADSIGYQDGAIVSRTLLDKKTGTVTLFAFDKNQGLSEHTAPFDALVYLVDGKAEIRIGGKPHVVQSGEFIIMPANIPHALKATERFKMILVMIRS